MKNLIVGAIVTGQIMDSGGQKINGRVEVFNPFNQRVCEMPILPGDEQILTRSTKSECHSNPILPILFYQVGTRLVPGGEMEGQCVEISFVQCMIL